MPAVFGVERAGIVAGVCWSVHASPVSPSSATESQCQTVFRGAPHPGGNRKCKSQSEFRWDRRNTLSAPAGSVHRSRSSHVRHGLPRSKLVRKSLKSSRHCPPNFALHNVLAATPESHSRLLSFPGGWRDTFVKLPYFIRAVEQQIPRGSVQTLEIINYGSFGRTEK